MKEPKLEQTVADAISETPVGKTVMVRFSGLAVPIKITMRFAGGWEIRYTLIPGMPLEFIRGEAGYMKELNITFMPHDGLMQKG